MVLVDFKGHFQDQKDPNWTFVIYLGQYLRNGACCDQRLYETHIQIHELPLKVKSRLQTRELCLINGASYDQSLYEILISKSYMAFQFTL